MKLEGALKLYIALYTLALSLTFLTSSKHSFYIYSFQATPLFK